MRYEKRGDTQVLEGVKMEFDKLVVILVAVILITVVAILVPPNQSDGDGKWGGVIR